MLGYINYRNNKKWEHALPEDMLNGQGMGVLRNYRYGLFSFGWCGCEIIAVYNFMKMLGKPVPLCEIAREIYTYGHLLLGFFGTNVYVLGYYLKRHHIDAKSTRNKAEFLALVPKAQCGVISFWTGKVLRSSIHTVAFRVQSDGSITVYNRYNTKDYAHEYANAQEAFGKFPFLTAHWV